MGKSSYTYSGGIGGPTTKRVLQVIKEYPVICRMKQTDNSGGEAVRIFTSDGKDKTKDDLIYKYYRFPGGKNRRLTYCKIYDYDVVIHVVNVHNRIFINFYQLDKLIFGGEDVTTHIKKFYLYNSLVWYRSHDHKVYINQAPDICYCSATYKTVKDTGFREEILLQELFKDVQQSKNDHQSDFT